MLAVAFAAGCSGGGSQNVIAGNNGPSDSTASTGGASEDAVAPGRPDDAQPLFEFLQLRGQNVTRIATYSELARALPNVQYVRDDGASYRASELLVVGRVLYAEPGIGLAVGGDSDEVVPFDAPDADLVTVHITMEVESAYGSEGRITDPPITVVAGLSVGFDGTRDDILKAAASLGRVVLMLRPNDVFSYADDVYGIVDSGESIVRIADDGALSLPAAAESAAASFLEAYPTLDSLEATAARPSSQERAPLSSAAAE